LPPNSELPLTSCRSASEPETRSPASMIQATRLLAKDFDAPVQFVYDIIEMTDCIFEAINSNMQVYKGR
jgi:hypothetical protein